MAEITKRKRGRKPGNPSRFTCAHCGAGQMVMGAAKPFYCDACRDAHAPLGSSFFGTGGPYAIGLVNRSIQRGEIPPASEFACADCSGPASQYDHRDYNKPLDVVPVCRHCNMVRGPAIPRKGYFTQMFKTEHWYYSNKKRAQMLFIAIGIDADLSHLPGYLTFEHWLPYKEALLAWEKAA